MTQKPPPDFVDWGAAGVRQFKAARQSQRGQKPSLYCLGRCDGMGDFDRDGSYVKIVYLVQSSSGYRENHIELSEGEAELLSAELQGALAQRSRVAIETGAPFPKCKRHVWSFDHSANEIRCTTPGCEAVR